MNYKMLKEFTSKKWVEIKSLEQEYKRNIDKIIDLQESNSDISFRCQKKLDDIEKAHRKYNKAI